MGINFFCFSSAAADILSWLHSQRTIVFVLFWARALASSNLSRPVLFPEKKKHSWASIFCSGTFLFNLKSSRPCRSIFSSSTKAWNSATFFYSNARNPVFHLRSIFLCSRFILARSFPANGTGCKNRRTRVIYYLLLLLLLSALIRFPLTSSLRSLWRDLLIRFLHCLGAWLLFVGWRHCRV